MLPGGCLHDIGDAAGCATRLEGLMTNKDKYFDAMAESKSMHKRVLDDEKQLELLEVWSQEYFEKQ